MAKTKRRVNRSAGRSGTGVKERVADANVGDAAVSTLVSPWVLWCRHVAAALLGGLIVYAAYFPSDSILVESGDALWFCAIALGLFTLTLSTEPLIRSVLIQSPAKTPAKPPAKPPADAPTHTAGLRNRTIRSLLGNGLIIDLVAWNLAAWMVIAALASCPPGNLRHATNEAWLWVAGAAMLTSVRRLIADQRSRAMTLALLFATSTGMAIHAMHQEWISLPQLRADYLAEPEKVLEAAGVAAPPMSSRRMIFASRLNDGGPTANFALANSLAAALMLSVILPVGLLKRFRKADRAIWINVALAVILIVGFSALIATNSRSAVLACLAGIAWVGMSDALSSKSASSGKRAVTRIVLALTVLGGLILCGVMLFGDDEWMAAAPASLEFRLQYWKSTIAMLWDHPLLGSGPGGFQSMYLQYRLPIASETVADPHNFFFETLASGGFFAGMLLIVLIWLLGRQSRRNACQAIPSPSSPLTENALTENAPTENAPTESALAAETTEPAETPAAETQWIVVGSIAALGIIWMLGIASGQLPDVQASLFALPVAAAAGWLAWKVLSAEFQSNDQDTRNMIGGTLVAVMVHLSVSGGWTVPGVAIFVWIGASMLAACIGESPRNQNLESESTEGTADTQLQLPSRLALAGFALGLLLLISIRFASIGPSQSAQFAQRRAEAAMQRGLTSPAEAESLAAVEADSWGFEAALWRSELLRGQIIGHGDLASTRDAWRLAAETAVERSGENPLVQRAIGEQCLHFYQRFGRSDDLKRADELISAAMRGNPTDAALVAQAGVIAGELSQPERCQELNDRAWELSLLGGNIVRHLDLKQIYVVEPLGVAAGSAGVMKPASKLLADRLTE